VLGPLEALLFRKRPVRIYLVEEALQELGASGGCGVPRIMAGMHRVGSDATAERALCGREQGKPPVGGLLRALGSYLRSCL